MKHKIKNIFNHLSQNPSREVFDSLIQTESLLIERIISHGQTTSEGEWYDQDRDEWVVVLQGTGKISFADGEILTLKPGDSVNIPAQCRHRVTWTDPQQPTLWLAVHYPAGQKKTD